MKHYRKELKAAIYINISIVVLSATLGLTGNISMIHALLCTSFTGLLMMISYLIFIRGCEIDANETTGNLVVKMRKR